MSSGRMELVEGLALFFSGKMLENCHLSHNLFISKSLCEIAYFNIGFVFYFFSICREYFTFVKSSMATHHSGACRSRTGATANLWLLSYSFVCVHFVLKIAILKLFRISHLVLRICSKILSSIRYSPYAVYYYTSDRPDVRRIPRF